MCDETLLTHLAEQHNSFYLYEEETILAQTAVLCRDFPDVAFLYSVKANPSHRILSTVFGQGFGADAASLAEVELARAHGLTREEIYYSAPGKTEADLAGALPHATLIADSLSEVDRIQAVANRLGLHVKIGVRINPAFSFGGGAAAPSKFGIDEEDAFAALPRWASLPNVEVVGLHVHLKSQELDWNVLEDYYLRLLALAHRFQNQSGRALAFLNMGSGIGIPYALADAPLDTATLGERLHGLVAAFRTQLPGTQLILETGRYVSGPAGIYVTRVVDKKVSRGTTFVLLHSTLNGFLKPSLAQLVTAYAPEGPLPATEPLFTGRDAYQFHPVPRREETETVTLAGSLCTAADVIAKGVTLPRLEVGDLVAIPNAGSYSAVLSPFQFSSQTPPAQLFLTRDGQVVEA